MAQLRRDYVEFTNRNAVVIVLGPEGPNAFHSYWKQNDLPFNGLPDPKGSVLKLYGQEVNLFKFGRMPAQIVIDIQGIVRYVHYGHDMTDIPSTQELAEILDEINQAEISE